MIDPHASHSHAPDPGQAWTAMRDWLIDSVTAMPWGSVLDLGPADHDEDSLSDDDVPCAQIVRLRDGTSLLRLSVTMMQIPPVAGFAVPRAMLDRWNYEDRFVDCTHGYLLSRSHDCVADLCVAWFRDRRGINDPGELGCSYTTPSELPQAG